MKKKALITGITSQDASFLAELLLGEGYEIFGLARRSSNPNFSRIQHVLDEVKILYGDMTDQNSLDNAVRISMPDECYNLASMSFVKLSWSQPSYTMNTNAVGTVRILESLRQIKPDCKFYQASSSEMFGKVDEVPQKETTHFHPRSPYGISKVAAYWTTVNYRESYEMFTCNGILFNHESERRGIEFVTRKITDEVARIHHGLQKELVLGNLEAKRDWGHARDYVEAMHLMLQQPEPDDYVIATGETHSVKEFVEEAFKYVGITDWSKYVRQDPQFMRPADVELLIGDYGKAKHKLGWEPQIRFKDLVGIMMENDLALVGEERKKLVGRGIYDYFGESKKQSKKFSEENA